MKFDAIRQFLGTPVYRSPYAKKLEGRIKTLEGSTQELLYTIDVLGGTDLTSGDGESGNPYRIKSAAVAEIYNKYQNLSQWGCEFVQRIINQRKGLVMPYGVQAQSSEKAKREKIDPTDELTFINRMLDYNDFNEGREDDLCKYAEMEGQMLVTLEWDNDGDEVGPLPRVKRKSWYDLNYDVAVTADDSDQLESISWEDPETGSVELVPGKDDFIYVAFNDINFIGTPAIGLVLGECENLQRALIGWRKANKFFAKWTPFFQADTWEEAQSIMEWMKTTGWKIGQGFAGRGMQIIGPQIGPNDSLYGEIKTNAQVISGSTGVPIHYLGFADVMANRATASELTEPMEVIALTDMVRWRGFYERLFNTTIKMRNEKLNRKLRFGLVKPKLAPVSDRQFARLTKFWLPAADKNLVSRELFIEQIPDIESGEELKRLNKESLKHLFGQGAVDEELLKAVGTPRDEPLEE